MPPNVLLSIVLGATFGTLFHLWRGKSLRDLIIYFLTGIIGFGLGQGFGNLMGFSFLLVGTLHIIEATIACWAGLFVIQWLKI